MGNTPVAIPARDDYCLLTGVVRWSHGTAILKLGDRYLGDERLMIERPDLFGSWADIQREVRRPYVRKEDCRQCQRQFIPTHDMSQYCSKTCRRERETLLRRAARQVNWRKWATIPFGDSEQLTEFVAQLDERISLLHLLIVHLGGRAYPHDDPRPTADEVSPLSAKLTDGNKLMRAATEAFNRAHAMRAEAEEKRLTALNWESSNRMRPAERHNGMGYAIARWGNGPNPAWEAELDALDEQAGVSTRGVAAAMAALQGDK